MTQGKALLLNSLRVVVVGSCRNVCSGGTLCSVLERDSMKVRQVIEAGPVQWFYMPAGPDNKMELTFEGGEIKLSLPEDVMKRLHQRLGEKLTDLAEKRLTEAKEMVESTQQDNG